VDKLEAIKFLRANDESCNEWWEAGMWVCVKRILAEPDEKRFTEAELRELLKYAERY